MAPPHQIGQLAGRVGGGIASVDKDSAGERATGEVRDQAVDGSEQGGLATAGAAHDQHEFTLGDLQIHLG